MQSNLLRIAPEIQEALNSDSAIVALESTVITHGLPAPDNLETAIELEQTIRRKGAIPATIAVIDGVPCIGLTRNSLERLAQNQQAMKLSRADLPMALARTTTGSTTVAATMILAALAGIRVFATGGIGGVHRGAELNFDISADLQELSRTNLTVICAGAKAILDLPKTLEVLETLGVPVLAYQQDHLPAFWSRKSDLKAPMRTDSVADIVRFIQARAALQLSGGVLVCNPVPAKYEIGYAQMAQHVQVAVDDALANNITGKSLTPWLLSRIAQLTDGQSLQANRALLVHNAQLASELAVSLADAID
ncbi:MAG: pseudouridine-5'-phosphate glycosidase [Granulosicoccus sp.]|nr:pseudouridine-5'-phosphate glycosidase [Granulosicoccus sp.]